LQRTELGGFRRSALALALALLHWGCAPSDELLERATQGDGAAQLALGERFAAVGEGQDLAAARDWYVKAAEQGVLQAQLLLAHAAEGEEEGKGEDADPAAAARWYRAAAEQGDQDAMRRLIVIYDEGRGVEKDPKAATKWLVELVEGGAPQDQIDLAYRYFDGKGTPVNPGRGAKLLERAAEQGSAEAQRALARLYTTQGNGVLRNLDTSVRWFKAPPSRVTPRHRTISAFSTPAATASPPTMRSR